MYKIIATDREILEKTSLKLTDFNEKSPLFPHILDPPKTDLGLLKCEMLDTPFFPYILATPNTDLALLKCEMLGYPLPTSWIHRRQTYHY
jgi:hypothetical protein